MSKTKHVQETFDKVVTHLRKQNDKSLRHVQFNGHYYDEDVTHVVGASALCTYRGNCGAMCAVGCLIADEHYSPVLEGKDVHDAHVLKALHKSGVFTSKSVVSMLSSLQDIHDSYPVAEWDYQLRRLASELGLSIMSPEK